MYKCKFLVKTQNGPGVLLNFRYMRYRKIALFIVTVQKFTACSFVFTTGFS